MSLVEPFFAYKRRNCRTVDGRPRRRRCAAPSRSATRASTRTATTAASGAAPARARARRTTLPRRRPVLRARDPEHPRPRLHAPGHDADHQPHLHRPRPAPARPRAQGPPPDEAIYKAPRRSMAAQNGYTSQSATSSTTRPARPRTGATTRPAARLHVRDRHGRVPPAVRETIGEYVGAGRVRRQGQPRGLPARDGERRRPSKHSVLTGYGPAGAQLRLRKAFVTRDLARADVQQRRRPICPRSRTTTPTRGTRSGSSTCSTPG